MGAKSLKAGICHILKLLNHKIRTMGFLSGKRADQLVDGAIKGIDALFFTKEEKAQQSIKVADAQVEYLKTTLNENTARSLTRRYLAIAIIGVFLLLLLVCRL